MRPVRSLAACLVAGAVSLALVPASSSAAPSPPGELHCGDQTFTVTGFGGGNALHLTTDTRTFVVTFAQDVSTGTVLADVPGQRDRADILSCTGTSTATGRTFNFRGFLTPR